MEGIWVASPGVGGGIAGVCAPSDRIHRTHKPAKQSQNRLSTSTSKHLPPHTSACGDPPRVYLRNPPASPTTTVAEPAPPLPLCRSNAPCKSLSSSSGRPAISPGRCQTARTRLPQPLHPPAPGHTSPASRDRAPPHPPRPPGLPESCSPQRSQDQRPPYFGPEEPPLLLAGALLDWPPRARASTPQPSGRLPRRTPRTRCWPSAARSAIACPTAQHTSSLAAPANGFAAAARSAARLNSTFVAARSVVLPPTPRINSP